MFDLVTAWRYYMLNCGLEPASPRVLVSWFSMLALSTLALCKAILALGFGPKKVWF